MTVRFSAVALLSNVGHILAKTDAFAIEAHEACDWTRLFKSKKVDPGETSTPSIPCDTARLVLCEVSCRRGHCVSPWLWIRELATARALDFSFGPSENSLLRRCFSRVECFAG